MLIAGLDLAAEPKGTALALIDWSEKSACIVHLQIDVTDEQVISTSRDAVKLGIDCALGWPLEFVDFVNKHSKGSAAVSGDIDWRRRMAYRETDRVVREVTGRWPLSVSTDRLGLTAMRCAGLIAKLQADGADVNRAGEGKIVEVYPAASLRLWGFDTTGYRTSKDLRTKLLAQIEASAPWFEPSEFAELMIDSCDAFDSVIANFAARSSQAGLSSRPSLELREKALVEGWLSLPASPLTSLIGER